MRRRSSMIACVLHFGNPLMISPAGAAFALREVESAIGSRDRNLGALIFPRRLSVGNLSQSASKLHKCMHAQGFLRPEILRIIEVTSF